MSGRRFFDLACTLAALGIAIFAVATDEWGPLIGGGAAYLIATGYRVLQRRAAAHRGS
jgi:hypothetical protein